MKHLAIFYAGAVAGFCLALVFIYSRDQREIDKMRAEARDRLQNEEWVRLVRAQRGYRS